MECAGDEDDDGRRVAMLWITGQPGSRSVDFDERANVFKTWFQL